MRKENISENDIGKLIVSTIKSISGRKNLSFNFKKNLIKISGNKIYLPETSLIKNRNELKNYRGIADFIALKLKFHSSIIHSSNLPKEKIYVDFYNALEEARIISLGSIFLNGVSSNLKNRLNFFFKKNNYHKVKKRENFQVIQAVKILSIQYFTKEKLPNIFYPMIHLWKPIIFPKILENLENLRINLKNQKKFSLESIKLIKKLKKYLFKNNIKEKEDVLEKTYKKNKVSDENLEKKIQKNIVFDNFISEKDASKKKTSDKKISLQQKKGLQKKKIFLKNPKVLNKELNYKIYCQEYDRTINAEDFSKKNELIKLNKKLEKESTDINKNVKKLAKKLQNKLMVKNYSFWRFEEEEGRINGRKLSNLISNKNYKKIYKRYEEKKIKDTVVTLLIDNSGSMRGRPINIAAQCSKIISQTLEKCSVKVEILGFTTKEWKGGKSRQKWVSDKMPDNPGRLNDLMHIIYKIPEISTKKIENNFGLMLKDGLLKENVDGESLLWAFNRIIRRKEKRKILMVISDGAPVDDSTISSNNSSYLENHLKKIIHLIEEKTNVEIVAIGIGHDVTKYYKKAVTINDPDQLGGIMIKKFTELFDIN